VRLAPCPSIRLEQELGQDVFRDARQKLKPADRFTIRTPATDVGLRKNGDVMIPL